MNKINVSMSLQPVNCVKNDKLRETALMWRTSSCFVTLTICHWNNRVVKCMLSPLGVTCLAAFAELPFNSASNYTNEVTFMWPFTSSGFVQTINIVIESWICLLREAEDNNYGTYSFCSVEWSWHCTQNQVNYTCHLDNVTAYLTTEGQSLG